MSDEHKPFPQTLSGQILLSTDSFDWDVFKLQFFDDWQTEIPADPVEDNLIFQLGEITVTLSLIKKMCPRPSRRRKTTISGSMLPTLSKNTRPISP